jgi:hypothetical protein
MQEHAQGRAEKVEPQIARRHGGSGRHDDFPAVAHQEPADVLLVEQRFAGGDLVDAHAFRGRLTIIVDRAETDRDPFGRADGGPYRQLRKRDGRDDLETE